MSTATKNRNGVSTKGLATFDLRPILNAYAGAVQLDDGDPYPVRHLDKPHWDIQERIAGSLRQIAEGGEAPDEVTATELYGLTAWCCPTASQELVESLNAQTCGAIIGIAARSVRQVEDAVPNASGPATEASPSPA